MDAFEKMSQSQKKSATEKKEKTIKKVEKKQRKKKEKKPVEYKPTYSLTVGNGGENHTGMEFIGSRRKKGEGWNLERLQHAKGILEDMFDLDVEIYNLNELLDGVEIEEKLQPEQAYFMLVKNFLAPKVHKKYLQELESYEWDAKYFDTRRQKVLNKHARTNVCYGSNSRNADFENKKGTIIGYDKSPLVYRLKQVVESLMQDKDLIVEGNKYINVKKNGIGPHGDTERVIVACLRVGEDMPMKYGWFHKSNVVGKTLTVNVPGGSLYFMSEKAVGADWKSRSKYTLRHAAGAAKYLKMKGEGD
jgi:hypothetical protein